MEVKFWCWWCGGGGVEYAEPRLILVRALVQTLVKI